MADEPHKDDHGHDDHDHHHDPLAPAHLIGHIKDAEYFEVPKFIDSLMPGQIERVHGVDPARDGKLFVPQVRSSQEPIWHLQVANPKIAEIPEPLDFRITKFMVIEVFVAIVCILLFAWLARKIASGGKPRGKVWNFLEAMLLFIRDQVARPAIGGHDADRFVPFLWTLFFFVLGCNLFGMLPWMGSPTGAFATTGALALITFCTVIGMGMAKMGPVGFWTGQVPHMDLPLPLAIMLKPMIFVIEVAGLCIKHFVLAVRLLANMMAGHMVLAVLVAFVGAIFLYLSSQPNVNPYGSPLFWGVSVSSILGAVALSLLELFVAFLQAYIFVFLSALFIGMAVHPH